MITIKGVLERLTYQNPDNHYTVARVKVIEASDPVTVVGYLSGVTEGESLKLIGEWAFHPKYGDQFKVESFNVILPTTTAGIKKYLASGIIKGMRKSFADRIVDYFKEQTLDIIENDPEKLLKIRGIGKAKKELIERAWNTHHSVRKVMQFLTEHNVGGFHSSEILRTYGSAAMDILLNQPYLIARDIPQVGFNIADMIARGNGIEKDNEQRLMACLIHCLLLLEQDGHVYALKDELIKRCEKISHIKDNSFEPVIQSLIDQEEIVVHDNCQKKTCVYLSRLFWAETGIANRIKTFLSFPIHGKNLSEEQILELVLSRLTVKLSDEQLSVIRQVLKQRIVVITGGPGTGKTTLVRALCEVFKHLRLKVALSAPTGRAARRLSEVTDKKAFTLHKLLGFDHENNTFERGRANPLDFDIFVVDEASMVDTMLMYHLLDAIPVNSVIILVGDTFQLPSVGPGNVLYDIINSDEVQVFSLTKIFRQAKESPIIMHAHSIRNGEMPDLKKLSKGEISEFYFIENKEPQKVVETILELCATRIKKAFPHIDEIQVLTPMHKGKAGTINLNQQLQKVLNDSPVGIETYGFIFKTNDKVMHLKNNYEKDVFNGDIGIVHEIIKPESKVLVDYDGRIVEYDILELDELTLAYTISVHKSQGSEYSAVVIALTTSHFPLLQRNLLYTAITRGKNLVIMVGSTRALEIALNNNKTDLRLSGLKEKLSR
jgi:exodeoxyribonuclease V alpha subunit